MADKLHKAKIGEEVANSAPTPVNPTDIPNKQYVDDTAIAKTANIQNLWTGTQADYDAITTKDANTLYFIQ